MEKGCPAEAVSGRDGCGELHNSGKTVAMGHKGSTMAKAPQEPRAVAG